MQLSTDERALASTVARCVERGLADGDGAVVVPALDAARAAGCERIRAFGEMVDILHRGGRLSAVLRLEELWNELLAAERIALLCAYALDPFDRAEPTRTVPRIVDVHSHLMPVEDGERLERATDRAFPDVFGVYGDTAVLRELVARRRTHDAAMPPAQGARLGLRELDPRLADAVLERAAIHYRGA